MMMVEKEQALELARAIARPGTNALLIGPKNESQGRVALPKAVASGRAFAVDVTDDILALDADDETKGRFVEEILAPELSGKGICPVVIASGQPGHRHLFARIEDGRLKEEFAGRAREQKIDERRTIRPPLAPHRQGLPVELISPGSVAEALEALRPTRPQSQSKGRLSSRIFKLLREGDSEGRYPSRSEVDMAIATAVVNSGLSENYLLRVLLNPDNVAGEKVREIAGRQGQRAAESYVSRTYAKAKELVRRSPAFRDCTDARAAIASLEQAVNRASWKGKAGGTDRAIIESFIQIADSVGSLMFQASIRQIAERSGTESLSTVLRSIGRLRQWVVRIKKGRHLEASTWQVKAPLVDLNENNNISRGSERYCSYEGHSAGEDIWRWTGLGKLAWLTWCAMWREGGTPREASVAEIATELGISRNAARRRLARLQRYGLAARGGNGRWHPVSRDLRELAEQFNVAGSSDRQQARHEEDRKAYRWNRSARRLQHSSGYLKIRMDDIGESRTETMNQEGCTSGCDV